jgi:hypothetical protein
MDDIYKLGYFIKSSPKLIKNEWQTYNNLTTDITELKKYIDNQFQIDCSIEFRYRLNNKYTLHSQILNISINNDKYFIPITIDFNYKIKFDRNIYNLSNLQKNNINRNEEIFICRPDLQKIIKTIKQELIQYLENYKKNSDNILS